MEGVANCVEKLGASLLHHSALGALGTFGSTNSDDWGPFVAPVRRQIVFHTMGPTRCAAPRRWTCRTSRTTRCACRRSRLPPSRPRSRWVIWCWYIGAHHCCRCSSLLQVASLAPDAAGQLYRPRTAACMAHRGRSSLQRDAAPWPWRLNAPPLECRWPSRRPRSAAAAAPAARSGGKEFPGQR